MVKLKNGEIFQVSEPLKKLMNEKLPVKVSYELAKMANKLNEPLSVIENVRNGLIRKYGEQDDSGQIVVKSNSESYEKLVVEMNELLDQDVEVELNGKVKLPLEVDGKELQIEPVALLALDKFVEV